MIKARARIRAALFLAASVFFILGDSLFAQNQGRAYMGSSPVDVDQKLLSQFDLALGERDVASPWVPNLEPGHMAGIVLIAEALSWQGVPYRLGGQSREGVDCSGFVGSVLDAALPALGPFPRTSEGFAALGKSQSGIEPGDILVFVEAGTVFHVGIALSEHSFIHSASQGPRRGVIISGLDEAYWARRLGDIRRIEY